MSLTTLDRAYLAKDAYEDRSREASATDAEKNVVQVGGRGYRVLAYVSKPSGYQGTAYRDLLSGEVTIASRGTEFRREFNRDALHTNGGMLVKTVNAQANDALDFAQLAIEKANEWAASKGKPTPPITAVGHSLGGSNAQIQAHHLGIRAETFNAYGTAELPIMQGPGKPGAQVVNHMAAGDFVSAASRHFGTQRVYATEADIAHLRQQDYGLGPYRPEVPGLASPATAMARWFTQPDPVSAAISIHGVGAHLISTMAPDRMGRPTVLTEANRQRYKENRALVDAYRNDIREARLAASERAQAISLAHTALETVRDAPLQLGQAVVEKMRTPDRDDRAPSQPPSYWQAKVGGALPPASSSTPTPARESPALHAREVEESLRQFLPDVQQPIRIQREPLSQVAPTAPDGLDTATVRTLQANLRTLGFTNPRGRPLASDGDYGFDTQMAVSAFQREQHLPANGVADPATRKLVEALATVAALQQQQAERGAPDVAQVQQAPESSTRHPSQPAPAADWNRHDPRLLNAQHYAALKTQFPQFSEEQLTAYTAAIHKAGIPPDEPLYKTKLWGDGTLSISTAKAQYPRLELDTNAPVSSIAESAQAVMVHDQQRQAEQERQQAEQHARRQNGPVMS